MQQWWGARVQAAIARGLLGKETAGRLQCWRRELHEQSFKVWYRIKYRQQLCFCVHQLN